MATRRIWRRTAASVLGSIVLLAGPLRAADGQPEWGNAVPAPALRKLVEMRHLADCLGAPTADTVQELVFRGRPSIEITGHERSGGSGTTRDLAVFDRALDRIVRYVCFTNASTRASGEAIVSLAEASGRADRFVRTILRGSNLELEGIKRHRTGQTESIYYQAGYLSASGAFPFLEAPVRLLLNATTGSLFRLDIDPDWLDPPVPPRVRLSRKAAERIATVVLRRRELAPAFGAGAVLETVAAAEMFTVYPNDWLGFFKEQDAARARVAWVVPFRTAGGDGAGLHSIFVDAASGLILGGLSSQTDGRPPR